MDIKRGVDKAEKNAMNTEDRYSYTGIKDACLTSSCPVKLPQERVTGLKGATVNSLEALMIQSLSKLTAFSSSCILSVTYRVLVRRETRP